MKEGWQLTSSGLELDPPQQSLYLVCTHEKKAVPAGGVDAHAMVYNMEEYFRVSVDVCRELFPNALALASASSSKVSSSWCPEGHEVAPAAAPCSDADLANRVGATPPRRLRRSSTQPPPA